MQLLDLSQDNPEDFEGKRLSLNGCNYRIGTSFREGDQGFAHLLFNEESGLCLHIIQIRPEYQSDPDLALGASRGKAEATAQLRADMRLKQPGVRIPAVSVVEVHGGSFELHEGTWGVFDNRKDAPGEAVFETAVSQLQDGDTETAIGSLEVLLEQYPSHTEALVFLAECKASLGEHVAALELVERAILIEPNSFHYLGARVAHALNGSYRFMAMSCFEALVQRFPLIDDFNADGIQCYLDCGEPGKAKALLDRSRLDEGQTRQFREVLSEASAVNVAYDAIEQKLQRPDHALTDVEKEQLVVDLKALHARYPSNPWIQANLGLMLRNTGQPESAAAFLNAAMNGLPEIWTAFCAANCGFSLAEAHHWDAALSSFHTTMVLIRDLAGDKFQAVDVPGSAVWLFREGSVIENPKSNPVALLDQAITHTSDRQLVTPDILLYKKQLTQAQDLYAPPVASKPPPYKFLWILTAAWTLAVFAFLGAVSLFSTPFDQDSATFGGVLLLSVAIILFMAKGKDYVKAHFLYHLPVFVLPAIGFVAGIAVAITRNSVG